MHHNRIAQSMLLSYFQVFYFSLLHIHHTFHFHFLHTYVHTLQVILRGLPVRPAFWKPAATTDKSKLRKQLGLATDAGRKTVLLMGGGDGVGGIENIACEVTAPPLEILRIITTTRWIYCSPWPFSYVHTYIHAYIHTYSAFIYTYVHACIHSSIHTLCTHCYSLYFKAIFIEYTFCTCIHTYIHKCLLLCRTVAGEVSEQAELQLADSGHLWTQQEDVRLSLEEVAVHGQVQSSH